MDKPQVLYHASPNKNIDVFEPILGKRPTSFEEGPVVFATDNFAFATHFLVETDSSWTADGTFNGVHYYVACDRDRFLASDKGGTVYTLSSDTFSPLKRWEWYSKVPVKPTDKKFFSSGLEAMLDNGVQVYFVNQDTFSQIRLAPDHGLSILKILQSENQKYHHCFINLP